MTRTDTDVVKEVADRGFDIPSYIAAMIILLLSDPLVFWYIYSKDYRLPYLKKDL
jgi:hypothetical protein